MKRFLVETYLGRNAAEERVAREERARSAAEEATRQAAGVRFDYSIHIPEDEICFFVFEAPSGDAAALVAEHAGLDAFRIVEAISSEKEDK